MTLLGKYVYARVRSTQILGRVTWPLNKHVRHSRHVYLPTLAKCSHWIRLGKGNVVNTFIVTHFQQKQHCLVSSHQI